MRKYAGTRLNSQKMKKKKKLSARKYPSIAASSKNMSAMYSFTRSVMPNDARIATGAITAVRMTSGILMPSTPTK